MLKFMIANSQEGAVTIIVHRRKGRGRHSGMFWPESFEKIFIYLEQNAEKQ